MACVRQRSGDPIFDCWAELCGQTGGWRARMSCQSSELECSDQSGPTRDGPVGCTSDGPQPHPITDPHPGSRCQRDTLSMKTYNRQRQEGIGCAQLSAKRRGLRCSAADAFPETLVEPEGVYPFMNSLSSESSRERSGHRVVSPARRNRCVIRPREIISVRVRWAPQILMLSGVGDPQELARHNIPVTGACPGGRICVSTRCCA